MLSVYGSAWVNIFYSVVFQCSVLIFCIVQLSMNPDCSTYAKYSSIMMFLVGIYIPNPKLIWKKIKINNMGCGQSKEPIEISISDSSSDFEPLEQIEQVELNKPKEQTVIYTKQMIREIFLKEYLKKNI